jgi:hypothetical protein
MSAKSYIESPETMYVNGDKYDLSDFLDVKKEIIKYADLGYKSI